MGGSASWVERGEKEWPSLRSFGGGGLKPSPLGKKGAGPDQRKRSNRSFFALQTGQTPGGSSRAQR
jgi:hypothetical protein